MMVISVHTNKTTSIMKKTYQFPTIKVVRLQRPQLLSGSLGYGNTTTAIKGNLSRQFSDDLLDDEEEY